MSATADDNGAGFRSPSDKRVISVEEPEKTDGNVEYKRQLLNCSPTRLEQLKTQLSYRLDEGNGCCVYKVGVEDDGCHSLMDYAACAETARVLEYLARSLNAVVIERKMIQKEIADNALDGTPQKIETTHTQTAKVVMEDSLLGDGRDQLYDDHHNHEEKSYGEKEDDDVHEHENDEKDPSKPHQSPPSALTLNKSRGVYTRCDLTVQRVETHLLDPSPILQTNASKKKDDKIRRASSEPSSSTPKSPKSNTNTNATTTTTPSANLSVGETLSSRNLRVAVVGNVDAGKSTLIGTLTSSLLDDGRGSSRTSIMKHRHEIESGRTSTASTHLMGFLHSGQAIAGTPKDHVRANRRKSEDEIAKESYRVVTLMDLAGHEKYLKTTIHGVTSGMADYALILVNSRHPPTHMTHHHLNLCASFGIHVLIVFTKIDGCPQHAFKTSKSEVCKLLRRSDIAKQPFEIRSEDDIGICLGKLGTLAPMISTSCVTGEGIGLLQKMLFALPKRRKHERKLQRSFEYLVDDIFNVPGVGSVVSGFVNAGKLDVGPNAHVYVGPMDDGTFVKTVAKSAHISRIHTSHVTSGQSACLALALSKDYRKKLRRGMVVLKESPTSTKEFDAEICVLKGEGTTIRRSYQAYVHILNVRQSAWAKKIEIVHTNALGGGSNSSGEEGGGGSSGSSDNGLSATRTALYGEDNEIVLRPGCRAKIRFVFAQRPEYVRPGMRMLFRDGRVRGVGLVTAIPTVQPAH